MRRILSRLYRGQHQARMRLAALASRGLPVAAGDCPELDGGRLLFIMHGLLGDSVMCLPAFTAARRLWPRARIEALCNPVNAGLLDAFEVAHDRLVVDFDPMSLHRRQDARRLASALRERRYDAAVILLGDQFAGLTARAGIPIRVGRVGHAMERLLTHRYDLGPQERVTPAERLRSLASLGGGGEDEARWSFPEPAPAAREAGQELLKATGLEPRRYILVHPFASAGERWWPAEEWRKLLRDIPRLTTSRAVLIGSASPGAAVDARDFADLRGQTPLPALVGLMEQSRCVVTTDSGPLHLAGALGASIVGLFRAARSEYASLYPGCRSVLGLAPGCEGICGPEKCRVAPCRQLRAIRACDVLREILALP